jgi:hypothetical protein
MAYSETSNCKGAWTPERLLPKDGLVALLNGRSYSAQDWS